MFKKTCFRFVIIVYRLMRNYFLQNVEKVKGSEYCIDSSVFLNSIIFLLDVCVLLDITTLLELETQAFRYTHNSIC